MPDIPDLDLHPVPNQGKLPDRVSLVKGAGTGSLSFHLYHGKYYIGAMKWDSERRYWDVWCDHLESEDQYIIVRRLQAHILKSDANLYAESGLPEETDTAILSQDWWNKLSDEQKRSPM